MTATGPRLRSTGHAGGGAGRWAAYVALAATDTWLAGRPRTRSTLAARFLTKPTLVPALALAAPPPTPAAALALAGSWAGDVALLSERPAAFRAGIGAFALAHAGYAAALAPHVDVRRLRSPAVRGLLAATALLAPVMGTAARRVDPSLGAPVAAYALCVASTAAATRAVTVEQPLPARRALAAGGTAFLVSDTVLGVRALVLATRTDPLDAPPRGGGLERTVMATYTLAQGLLAAGLRGLRPR